MSIMPILPAGKVELAVTHVAAAPEWFTESSWVGAEIAACTCFTCAAKQNSPRTMKIIRYFVLGFMKLKLSF
jgi:hypothetical protein